MNAIVEGIYKQGRIELADPPVDFPEGPVRLILLADKDPNLPLRQISFGMYPGDASTLEDFQDARWQKEWDGGHGQ